MQFKRVISVDSSILPYRRSFIIQKDKYCFQVKPRLRNYPPGNKTGTPLAPTAGTAVKVTVNGRGLPTEFNQYHHGHVRRYLLRTATAILPATPPGHGNQTFSAHIKILRERNGCTVVM